MLADKLDALSRMTVEHMAMPFPPGFRGVDIEAQDMVMLDADAYGCAASALKGPLADRQRAALTRVLAAFDRVLPAIDDAYASRYYSHLHKASLLAAEVDELRER